MALPAFLIPAAVSVAKAAIGFFKKKNRSDKVSKLQSAIETINELMNDAETDPELKELLIKKEIEFERLYTERVKASLEVIKAEATSEDPYVRRARPTWLYASILIFVMLFCVFPILRIEVTKYVPMDILDVFLKAVTAGFLGYGAFRTIDKKRFSLPHWGK